MSGEILRSRLPERLAGGVPAWVIELAVAAIVTALFAGVRLAFVPITGDRAPYAFVFVSIVIAAVLAGWKSRLPCTRCGTGHGMVPDRSAGHGGV